MKRCFSIIAVSLIVLLVNEFPFGIALANQERENDETGLSLKVLIGEFRSAKGDLRIELSNETGEVLANEIHPVTGNTVTVQFNSLTPGSAAVRLFHDENKNGKLDTNFFGIPTEGYGFSNNPRSRFGEPPQEDRLFELRADTTISVKLIYW